MTPNEFVNNAVRTESRIEVVQANETFLNDLLDSITSLSTILDQIKKNVFYGRKFNYTKVLEALRASDYMTNRMIASFVRPYGEINPLDEKTELKVNPRIFHCIVGLATETAELLEAIKLDSPDFDKVNILEELGDQQWYQAIGIDALGASMEQDVLDRVIAKLRARYPDKFTSENAINRDLVKERKVLEGDSGKTLEGSN